MEGGGGPPQIKVTVRWESAGPLQELNAKVQNDERAKALTEWSKDHYIVSVSGMPGGMGGMGGGGGRGPGGGANQPDPDRMAQMAQRLKATTVLKPKGRDAANPVNLARVPGEKGQTLIFLFARTLEISLDDKEVAFETAMGPVSVKAKFAPKTMMYQGKLAL